VPIEGGGGGGGGGGEEEEEEEEEEEVFRYSLATVVLNLAFKVHCRRKRVEWERGGGNQTDAFVIIVSYVPA
jgi:hypothetical protein